MQQVAAAMSGPPPMQMLSSEFELGSWREKNQVRKGSVKMINQLSVKAPAFVPGGGGKNQQLDDSSLKEASASSPSSFIDMLSPVQSSLVAPTSVDPAHQLQQPSIFGDNKQPQFFKNSKQKLTPETKKT